jgi:hypothetical protein
VIVVAVATMIVIAIGEQIFLKSSARKKAMGDEDSHAHRH